MANGRRPACVALDAAGGASPENAGGSLLAAQAPWLRFGAVPIARPLIAAGAGGPESC